MTSSFPYAAHPSDAVGPKDIWNTNFPIQGSTALQNGSGINTIGPAIYDGLKYVNTVWNMASPDHFDVNAIAILNSLCSLSIPMEHHVFNLQNLFTLLKRPSRLIATVHFFLQQANIRYFQRRENDGTDVMSEAWDTLLLLDGCRYDVFKNRCKLNGRLESRWSKGSDSHEFITENFVGRELHDTVYVTSNPYISSVDEGTFHAIENVLKKGWDNDLRTVTPATMREAVVAAHERYPKKRIIGHFMQPHFPFIGEVGQRYSHGGIPDRDVDSYYHEVISEGKDDNDLSVWNKLQFKLDGVTDDWVREAYAENLDIVLEEVEQLTCDIEGKVVVSADHGNLIGDWIGPIPCRGYGHPRHLHVEPLMKVPWFIIENGPRRDIQTDTPLNVDEMDRETLEDRLSALGYR